MKDQYIPHLQRHCSYFMKSRNPVWGRFDLDDLLQKFMDVGLALAAGEQRQALCRAVSDMCVEDPAIAQAFVNDSFTRLGFRFSWALSHIYNVSPSTQLMKDNILALKANMDEHDHENTVMPQKIFTSNIFSQASLEGVTEPVINPLILRVILSAKGEGEIAAINTYFETRPPSRTQARLLTLIKDVDLSPYPSLSCAAGTTEWSELLIGLEQLERARLIDPDKVIAAIKDRPRFANTATDLVRAVYDADFAAIALPEVLKDTVLITQPSTLDKSEDFKTRAILKIVNAHAEGSDQALALIRDVVMGNRPDPQTTTVHYASLARVLLTCAAESEDMINSVLGELAVKVREPGVVRAKCSVLSKLMFEWDEEPFYSKQLGVSPEIDALIGDLACQLIQKDKERTIDQATFQELLDNAVLNVKQVKGLLRCKAGRALCVSARLPSGMLQQLPANFRDDVFSSDLGI